MTRPPIRRTIAAATLAAAALAAPAAASSPPALKAARCYSSCLSKKTVMAGGKIEVRGRGLRRKMRVVFQVQSTGGQLGTRSAKARLTKRKTLVARVPRDARSGSLYAETPSGSHTNSVRVRVARGSVATAPRSPGNSAFDGNGMWIWYVSKSSGGSVPAIVSKARAHNIDTVFIKSSDGSSWWSQFSSALVGELKQAGLNVCAWQYVYGSRPTTEASLGARAARTGADCLVIDAESQYEGKYDSARTYVSRLRSAVGSSYPVGLAGFPYVDYHESFPYSVFLGPDGAQYNVPQVYWKDIGTSVSTALAHTYAWNLPYGRPIYPLGQLYQSPSSSDIVRFRQLSAAYGASGVSWWDWQEATSGGWRAVGADIEPWAGPAPARQYAVLAKGARGDTVLWAQQHLRAAGQSVSADGKFGSSTQAAVMSFQSSAGLPVTGQIDTATWDALLGYATARAAGSQGRVSAASVPRREEIAPAAARK